VSKGGETHALANAIEAALDGRPFEAARLFLAQHVPVDNAVAFRFRHNVLPEYLYDSVGAVQRFPLYDAFIDGIYKLSPYYNALISTDAREGFYRIGQVAPDDFTKSTYYSEYYEKKQVVDEGLFLIRCDEGCIVYLVERSGASALFDEAESAVLGSLLPVVKALLWRERSFPLPLPDKARGSDLAFPAAPELTRRERQVADLILQGHSSKSAARELGISPHTERVHRKRLYHRLGIGSQSELFRIFAEAQQRSYGAREAARSWSSYAGT